MKSRLVLLLIVACALFPVTAYADPVVVPNSETSIALDGDLTEPAWADANTIQFTAVNGGVIEALVKYDTVEGELCFGLTIPDASFDIYDRFFICVDNGDDMGLGPQEDDFILAFSRDTAYMGMYHQYYEFYRVRGTGDEWDLNNLLFDSRVLAEPFRQMDWFRTDSGDAWGFELKLSLNRDPVHEFGLVFKQLDVEGDSVTQVYYPEEQPDAVNYPTNWMSSVIPEYTPEIIEEPQVTPEVPGEHEVSSGIPGFPFVSLLAGMSLILVLRGRPETS